MLEAYEDIPFTQDLQRLLNKPGNRAHLKPVIDSLDNAANKPGESGFTDKDVADARKITEWLRAKDAPRTPATPGKTTLYGPDGKPLLSSPE